MDLQRADVRLGRLAHSLIGPAVSLALGLGCRTPPDVAPVEPPTSEAPALAEPDALDAAATPAAAPPRVSGADLPGGLADRFAEPTERQAELRDTAAAALAANEIDIAITALLALREEPPMSEPRAAGMLLLSELYFQQERAEDALSVLEELRPASPPQGRLEFLLGRTYRHLDRLVEAEDAWRRAIRMEPDFVRSYHSLAGMLRGLGREADAQEVELGLERRLLLLTARVINDAPEAERLAAIEALGLSPPDERVARALVPALTDPSPMIAVTAAMALSRAGTSSAIAPLREARERATDDRIALLLDQALAELEVRLAAQ